MLDNEIFGPLLEWRRDVYYDLEYCMKVLIGLQPSFDELYDVCNQYSSTMVQFDDSGVVLPDTVEDPSQIYPLHDQAFYFSYYDYSNQEMSWMRAYVIIAAMEGGLLRWFKLPELRFMQRHMKSVERAIPFLSLDYQFTCPANFPGNTEACEKPYGHLQEFGMSHSMLEGIPKMTLPSPETEWSSLSLWLSITHKNLMAIFGFPFNDYPLSLGDWNLLAFMLKEYMGHLKKGPCFWKLTIEAIEQRSCFLYINLQVKAENPIKVANALEEVFR